MDKSVKKFFLPLIVLIILFSFIAGLWFFSSEQVNVLKPESESLVNRSLLPGVKNEKNQVTAVRVSTKPAKKKFNTNEDIRQEYGRLEIVYLFNGKKYEGAVISIDKYYTMVTIEGIVKIPMEKVKVRDIIK